MICGDYSQKAIKFKRQDSHNKILRHLEYFMSNQKGQLTKQDVNFFNYYLHIHNLRQSTG